MYESHDKTLEDLEGVTWPPPDYDSYLVSTVNRLRKVRVADLSTEDLRLLIGQRVGLLYIVPLALELLEQNPLAEGDFYPGDLLNSLISVREFLTGHPVFLERVSKIVQQALQNPEIDPSLREHLSAFPSKGTVDA